MADDLIRYDVLLQDALRGVVRKVMREVADGGLPGDHHFYIAFETTAPGVRMSSRLRQEHSEEMTIVLKHQFWDLAVSEHGFEVGLSFGGVPERLLVPFAAVRGFYDPSVQFGLEFKPDGATQTSSQSARAEVPKSEAPRSEAPQTSLPAPAPSPADSEAAATSAADGHEGADDTASDGGDAEQKSGAEVVSLDAFRKRTQ